VHPITALQRRMSDRESNAEDKRIHSIFTSVDDDDLTCRVSLAELSKWHT
jgi:hypothetical protein